MLPNFNYTKQISILQPAASSIRDSNAVTAEALAAEALEVYDDGRGGRTPAGDGGSTSDAAANVKTGVASVAKNPSNHVVSKPLGWTPI